MSDGKKHLGAGTEDSLPRAPVKSFVLAYAAMVPIVAGAIAGVMWRGAAAGLATHLTVIWSGALLCFLSGVRRGLSFRQEGGPLLSQLITMLWLFVLGVASLVSPWEMASLLLEIVGYTTMAVFDPVSARQGEVPQYFQRLRPVQMLIPIASLAAIGIA